MKRADPLPKLIHCPSFTPILASLRLSDALLWVHGHIAQHDSHDVRLLTVVWSGSKLMKPASANLVQFKFTQLAVTNCLLSLYAVDNAKQQHNSMFCDLRPHPPRGCLVYQCNVTADAVPTTTQMQPDLTWRAVLKVESWVHVCNGDNL
eukprot:SAG31_NODE_2838_length_5017_cov_3.102074_6_plen_149_part_00